MKPVKEQAIIINLGGGDGMADADAGVFVDGRRLFGVTSVQVQADSKTGQRSVQLTISEPGRVHIVGQARVQARTE